MTPVEELVELVVTPAEPEIVEIYTTDQPVIEVFGDIVEILGDDAVVTEVLLDAESFELVVADVSIEVVEVVATGPQGPPGTGGGSGGGSTGYTRQDQEKVTLYAYVGYKHASGAWYIYRREITTGDQLQATGASDYPTAWAGRAGLPYA